MNTPHTQRLTRKEQLIEEIAHLVLQKLDESNHSQPDTELLEEGVKDWVKGALLAFSLLAPSKFADPSSAANLQGFINRMNTLEQTLDRQEVTPTKKAKILGGAAIEYVQQNPQDTAQVVDLMTDISQDIPELDPAIQYLESESPDERFSGEIATPEATGFPEFTVDQLEDAVKRAGLKYYHLQTFTKFYEEQYGERLGVNRVALLNAIRKYPRRFTIVDGVVLKDEARGPSRKVSTVGVILKDPTLVSKNGGSRVRVPVYDAGQAGYLIH